MASIPSKEEKEVIQEGITDSPLGVTSQCCVPLSESPRPFKGSTATSLLLPFQSQKKKKFKDFF